MRSLTSVLGNSQRLDGGAMFGNAPKAMWERWIPPDDSNRIPLACRCLLVRDGERLILFETGIGAFFEPALRVRYGVVEDRLRTNRHGLGLCPTRRRVAQHIYLLIRTCCLAREERGRQSGEPPVARASVA